MPYIGRVALNTATQKYEPISVLRKPGSALESLRQLEALSLDSPEQKQTIQELADSIFERYNSKRLMLYGRTLSFMTRLFKACGFCSRRRENIQAVREVYSRICQKLPSSSIKNDSAMSDPKPTETTPVEANTPNPQDISASLPLPQVDKLHEKTDTELALLALQCKGNTPLAISLLKGFGKMAPYSVPIDLWLAKRDVFLENFVNEVSLDELRAGPSDQNDLKGLIIALIDFISLYRSSIPLPDQLKPAYIRIFEFVLEDNQDVDQLNKIYYCAHQSETLWMRELITKLSNDQLKMLLEKSVTPEEKTRWLAELLRFAFPAKSLPQQWNECQLAIEKIQTQFPQFSSDKLVETREKWTQDYNDAALIALSVKAVLDLLQANPSASKQDIVGCCKHLSHLRDTLDLPTVAHCLVLHAPEETLGTCLEAFEGRRPAATAFLTTLLGENNEKHIKDVFKIYWPNFSAYEVTSEGTLGPILTKINTKEKLIWVYEALESSNPPNKAQLIEYLKTGKSFYDLGKQTNAVSLSPAVIDSVIPSLLNDRRDQSAQTPDSEESSDSDIESSESDSDEFFPQPQD